MLVKTFEVGALGVNCYIATCDETKESVIIDPGADPLVITNFIRSNNLSVKYVINTHGHIDHTGANKDILNEFPVPLVIHKDEVGMLKVGHLTPFAVMIGAKSSPPPGMLVSEGDVITFGQQELEVLHTPGHSPGGMCLYSRKDRILFSGDTLFAMGIGRTDLPGGSYELLMRSITDKIYTLPDDVVVYPGHGPATTVGDEKRNNPWIRDQ